MLAAWRERFLVELRRIGIIYVAAQAAGVSREAVYYHRRRDVGFRREIEAALRAHVS